MTTEPEKQQTEPYRAWIRSLIIIALGVLLSGAAFVLSRQLENALIQADFENFAADRVAAVADMLEAQKALLTSIASFASAAPNMDDDLFGRFVLPLLNLQTALVGISWAPLIRHDQRPALVASARAEGLSGFAIRERNENGRLILAADRPGYAPVLYMRPFMANIGALGYDLFSEAKRRAALEAARDSGQLQASRRLQLVQDEEPRDSLMSVVPVYRPGAALSTIEQRRAALTGFICKVYWIDDLITRGLDRLQPGGVDLAFYDPADGAGAQPAFVHRSRTRGADSDYSPAELNLQIRSQLDVGGRIWEVVSTPAPQFISSRRGYLPWMLAGLGLLATVWAQIFFVLQHRRARQIEGNAQQLRDLVFQMPVLLVALDENQRLVVWNLMCEQVTGYSASEVIGSSDVLRLLHIAKQNPAENDAGLPINRDFARVSRRGRDRNDVEFVVEWYNSSNTLPIPGWDCWFMGVDVTEREKMQQQLLQRQKLESLGVLAGGVAHDFNNLLTAIMGNASLVQLGLDGDSPMQTALESVIDASQRASKLTAQLLAYAGKSRLKPVPLDIAGQVETLMPMLQSLLPGAVSLRVSADDDLPFIHGDAAQIQQLLTNLVTNAGEAFEQARGIVQLTLKQTRLGDAEAAGRSSQLPAGNYLCLQISDQGAGMESETLKKVFDPFFSTKFTGRGLGLAAAQGIVRSHGGEIEVQSSPGEGTVVSVFLPVNPAKVPAGQPETGPADASPEIVLIVDDEDTVARLSKTGLERAGHQVLVAASGQQAVDLFKERARHIACVVLDMNMPDMDGEQTLVALRDVEPEIPVVLTSGYSQFGSVKITSSDRHTCFLQKPYTPTTLARTIEQLIGNQT